MPDAGQIQFNQKLVLERLVAVQRHTELTGKDGEALIPPEPPTVRELSRAVLGVGEILRQAKLAEADAEPDEEG